MWRYRWSRAQHLLATCMFVSLAPMLPMQANGQYESREARLAKVEKTFGDPPGMKRLTKKDRVWVDVKRHLVVVDGYIAMRNGQLEMFACPAGTKEHESVVGVFSKAQYVHAALLAAGARPGKPVQWEPTFAPPSGSEVEIRALWFDASGNKQAIDARKWIRQLGTDNKTLEVNWVFAGSIFWKDPETGEERYMAESGDLVCLSNFTTATLDIPIQSSQANSGLLFAAYTNRIPPEGTPVRLVFRVIEPSQEAPSKEDAAKVAPGKEDAAEEDASKEAPAKEAPTEPK